MGWGDILFLYTDGFSEFTDDRENDYFPGRLEEILKQIKNEPVKDIYFKIKEDLMKFGKPADDITFVLIKKV